MTISTMRIRETVEQVSVIVGDVATAVAEELAAGLRDLLRRGIAHRRPAEELLRVEDRWKSAAGFKRGRRRLRFRLCSREWFEDSRRLRERLDRLLLQCGCRGNRECDREDN